MTANERTLQSVNKELEKLYKRKERLEKLLEKKTAAAEKVGMNISNNEFFKVRDNINDKQYAAYFELSIARDDLNEVLKKIEKRTVKKETTETTVKKIKEQITAEELERRKAEEINRWYKDGIDVKYLTDNHIYGKTPKGKKFSIYSNNGLTDRSRHCFTLTIDGETIFTSGEFYRAYKAVKNN